MLYKDTLVKIFKDGELYEIFVSQLRYGDIFYDSQDNMWLVDVEPYVDNFRWTIDASVIGFKSKIRGKIK